MNNLVVCPTCAKAGKNQVLGRLLENGDFLVLRFHHGTTILQGSPLKVKCGCGYTIEVTSGAVVVQK